ncbi:hypothetical protein [Streptomyces sp. NPDC048641]|uniref:hypothetical protein n=1 Tax=unclassified Streptomyces TaxID=2593676 RepID=UPI00342872C6
MAKQTATSEHQHPQDLIPSASGPGLRLLPWPTPDGRPCFLSTDGSGYLSRVADNVESLQLGMASELLNHVADLLDDRSATCDQLRFCLARMTEALRDVRRIADSRGARLPDADNDPDLIAPDTDDDDDDDPHLPTEPFA